MNGSLNNSNDSEFYIHLPQTVFFQVCLHYLLTEEISFSLIYQAFVKW